RITSCYPKFGGGGGGIRTPGILSGPTVFKSSKISISDIPVLLLNASDSGSAISSYAPTLSVSPYLCDLSSPWRHKARLNCYESFECFGRIRRRELIRHSDTDRLRRSPGAN